MPRKLPKGPFLIQWIALFLLCLSGAGTSQATVVSYSQSGDKVTFKLDKGLMSVRICRADIVQVQYTVLRGYPTRRLSFRHSLVG